MNENLLTKGETAQVSQVEILVVKEFLTGNYLFRRNILNGKVEFADRPKGDAAELSDDNQPVYRALTPEALNSIIIRAKIEQIIEGNPKSDIIEYVQSEEIPFFNPIKDFLESLPEWDGHNHVARLFGRLPGISTEQMNFLTIWLRSAVAHWLQMDTLHGNECVPTLIGAQGCGKTTFFKRLLPMPLREYFLDHLNLSNKFDKEMALTNNLLVCLDELDTIRPSQHPALKQTLSKSKVNGRPIFGKTQADRLRFASFVATTNNQHPLTDATGSRRYICLTIPQGHMIDNEGDIDYRQLYAQVVYELRVAKVPYWFNNSEVARIQELNQNYMGQTDMKAIINACFRKPKDDEKPLAMNTSKIIAHIQKDFPTVKDDQSTKVFLGLAMKELEYERTERGHVAYYKVVPLKVA
ncbi:MAG: VapE family protein [Prevotellaceae bacterium]|nr:VapE family protein [Prevotellaceae bacterium]